MHPQTRLSEFDKKKKKKKKKTWHIHSPYGLSSGNGVFFNLGLELLPVLERHLVPKLPSTVYKANCYVILHIFICHSFQKCIINDTFAVNYLKCYSYYVRNCFLWLIIYFVLYFTIMYLIKGWCKKWNTDWGVGTLMDSNLKNNAYNFIEVTS